ncbi:MAG: molybdopterin molybdotransferase MoeA [Candidatus Limnocylindria bacterium]|nr:molybdopterin molybdotransferase MoeA [Candidatus Limnocylindria bacterium]
MTTSPSAARVANRLLTVDEALERILARVAPLPARTLDLADTLGGVLAEDVVADRDVPPFRNSAMDGYAVRGEDVSTAPVRLRVTGAVAAGGLPEGRLGPGEAVRIMTGAPMPEGADTVVRVEDTREAGSAVEITAATARGTSVRAAGEDVRSGSTVLATGRLLRPAEIGVLAALGRARVRVTAKPRVAVLSTGDELVELDAALGPGRIRDANRYSLGAAVRAAGCDPWPLGIARDTADDLRRALVRASEADAIVTSGGVSVGDHDHVKPVVESMGTMDFWSIAIRPGRPLAFGELGPRRTPIFGLPGNPVSALLTFELFVRPALLRMAGRTSVHRPRARAVLVEDVEKPAGLRFFARGVHDPVLGTVRTTGPQGSGILTSMALANCLIDLPATADRAAAGSEVTVILTDLPEDH